MFLVTHKRITFLKVNKKNFNSTLHTSLSFWASHIRNEFRIVRLKHHSRKFCNANYHPVACKLINFADVCESPYAAKSANNFQTGAWANKSTEGRRRNIKPSCGNTLVSISPAVSQHSRIASNCEQCRCRLRIRPDVPYWKRGQNITRVRSPLKHSVGRRVMLWSWAIDCFAADYYTSAFPFTCMTLA